MRLSRIIILAVLAGALALILSACGARSRPAEETVARAPAAALSTATSQPTAEPTVQPTATPQPTASPTPTATPTNTVTPSPTPTPTATATPPNPLSVAYMREQEYPGSDIVIEQKLQAGSELPALHRFLPLRGAETVRPADGAQRDAACDRLAGDRLQPRLHPARAIPDDRALRRLRGWLSPATVTSSFGPTTAATTNRKGRRREGTARPTTPSTC